MEQYKLTELEEKEFFEVLDKEIKPLLDKGINFNDLIEKESNETFLAMKDRFKFWYRDILSEEQRNMVNILITLSFAEGMTRIAGVMPTIMQKIGELATKETK